MGKKKSSFHMGDEFNGNGQKVYLRPTQHRTYTPLSQQGVRLTPDFSQFVPKAIGAIPVGCKSANVDSKTALKALGGIPSVSQVMIKKEKKTGTYKGEFRVRKKQLTTGGSLQEKRGWYSKAQIRTPDVLRGEPIKIAPWLTAYDGKPVGGRVVEVLEGEEELCTAERNQLGDANLLADGTRHIDWYSYENYTTKDENGNIVRTINAEAAKQLQANNKKLGFIFTQEEGLRSADGRYWVAVGPQVLCPGYNNRPEEEQILAAEQFRYGTKIDVVLQHMDNESRLIYIKCIAGDVMGHSYSNGVFQTGDPYPNSSNKDEDGSYARNGAYVEFINAPTVIEDGEEKHINFYGDERMSDYVVVRIIVYDEDW